MVSYFDESSKDQRQSKPEEKARIKIDEMLTRAGWDVISRNEYSDMNNACAVTEGLLKGN